MNEGGGSIFDSELFVPTQGFMGCPNRYELDGAKLAPERARGLRLRESRLH